MFLKLGTSFRKAKWRPNDVQMTSDLLAGSCPVKCPDFRDVKLSFRTSFARPKWRPEKWRNSACHQQSDVILLWLLYLAEDVIFITYMVTIHIFRGDCQLHDYLTSLSWLTQFEGCSLFSPIGHAKPTWIVMTSMTSHAICCTAA